MDLTFEPLIGLELFRGERLDGLGDEEVVIVGAIFVNYFNFSPDGCSRASLEELVGVGLGFFLGFGRNRKDAVFLEEVCEGAFQERDVGYGEELGNLGALSSVGGCLGEDLWHRRGNESLVRGFRLMSGVRQGEGTRAARRSTRKGTRTMYRGRRGLWKGEDKRRNEEQTSSFRCLISTVQRSEEAWHRQVRDKPHGPRRDRSIEATKETERG